MRPTLDQYYTSMLLKVAERGTCPRRQVAAILTDSHGKLLASGYNGVPAGFEHCIDHPCPGAQDRSGDNSRCWASHAEVNCLLQAGDRVAAGAVLYCSCSPCFTCSKLIASTPIKRVVYLERYPDEEAFRVLRTAGILVELFTASTISA